MKVFVSVLMLGICLWLGSAYYSWYHPQEIKNRSLAGQILSAPSPPMINMEKSEKGMITGSPPTPTIVEKTNAYAEIKFWVEKSGQVFASIGTVGTIIQAIRRRKK